MFNCRLNVELPLAASLDGPLWRVDYSSADFGMWVQNTPNGCIQFVNQLYILFENRPKTQPLRFMYSGTHSNVHKSDITYLPPMLNAETKTTEDIEKVVEEFRKAYIEGTLREFAVIYGDYQVWCQLFLLLLRNPAKYFWLIPMPGEWHWTWHILKGIYKMYYRSILLPFSKIIGFRSLDEKADNFHYAEDLLEMVTIAVFNWMKECIDNTMLTPMEWLESIWPNKIAHELAYACLNYFIPYMVLRSALKWNKMEDMEDWWRWWIHLFIATKKRNYALMSLRVGMLLNALNPDAKAAINPFRVLSFTGAEGTGIPTDGVCEMVCDY